MQRQSSDVFHLQEIFVILCLTAVITVQAYPSEGIESEAKQPVSQVEVEPSKAEESDLEGSESRYGGWGGGWGGRGYGGWGGRGYGGWGGRGYGKIWYAASK